MDARQSTSAELAVAELPLLNALSAIGVRVKSIWQFDMSVEVYRRAIPIPLAHLQMPYPDEIREGIARALASRDAIAGWPILLAEYEKEMNGRVKVGLACAISRAASSAVIPDVIRLSLDRRNGESRVLLLKMLKKSKTAGADCALEVLRTDPEMAEEIASWRTRSRASPSS
jgi:hypothetical protein